MKLKILVLLLMLALLTACSAANSENASTEAEQIKQTNQTNPAQDPSENAQTEVPTGESVTTEAELTKIPARSELAALALYGLSMEYFDGFDLQGFYYDENADEKDGIYVIFDSYGQTVYAHVYAIAAGRTEAGTKDLYCPEVGYAAFDLVDSVADGLTQIAEEDYVAVLNDLSMPTVYSN